ncbi:MAG: glucose-6-phosphate dehydrogenase [Neptuniibacter sp.]
MNLAENVCNIVLFGGLGDLAQRKLFPALYQLDCANLLSPDTLIYGLARDTSGKKALDVTEQNLRNYTADDELSEKKLSEFLEKLRFLSFDFNDHEEYSKLSTELDINANADRLFYFSTPASIYGTICEGLSAGGCLNSSSRVVLEKPIGHSFDSSLTVNSEVAKYFDESQIYRIDHYLGKETVQNLIALRFANNLFGSQWNQNFISYIEITIAEKVGIEGRWGYFDKYGQLRDMLQNHLLQLLCLVAMDPPSDLSSDAIRNEKVKVLKALRPITEEMLDSHLVHGQYMEGYIDGDPVPGYLEEDGANTESSTETFIALKAEVENWRWAGVPFYLRTGKRMPEKLTQITVHFRQQPHYIFDPEQRSLAENALMIKVQPDEGISLQVLSKEQGLNSGMKLRKAPLHLSFSDAFSMDRVPDAYERLLLEAINANQNLFVRSDEIEYAWKWCDQIISHLENRVPPMPYPAGCWGPEKIYYMIEADKKRWHEQP